MTRTCCSGSEPAGAVSGDEYTVPGVIICCD